MLTILAQGSTHKSGAPSKNVSGDLHVEGVLSAGSLSVRNILTADALSANTLSQSPVNTKETYVMSTLQCLWNGGEFTRCPNDKVISCKS